MDYLIALIVSLTLILIVWMVTRAIEGYYRQKVELSRRMSMVRRRATSKREDSRDVAPWVKELIERFGHDPEELYEDEMPDDLEQLLSSPMVKGILAGLQQGGKASGEGENQAAPGSVGGWFGSVRGWF